VIRHRPPRFVEEGGGRATIGAVEPAGTSIDAIDSRSRRARLAGWWRWMAQPWRSGGLIVALVASFAAPALMASSAPMFRESAADSVTTALVEENVGQLDVTVAALGRVATGPLGSLGEEIDDQLRRIPELGPTERTVFASQIGLEIPPATPDEPFAPLIGSGGTLLQRDGAIEALDVVTGDPATVGIWISERSAERLELAVGDLVVIGGGGPLPIAGIYENLWEGERDPYWATVPPTLAPRYSRVLRGPLVELYFVPADALDHLDIPGGVRWDAAVVDPPRSQAALERLTTRYRDVERSFTESSALSSAIGEFSGAGTRVPSLTTDAFELRDEVDEIVDGLSQPIGTAAVGGVLLGLMITAAGAAFAVRKRRVEFRLLRSDGDPGWLFAGRALLQYTPPALLGVAVGVASAVLLVGVLGPSGTFHGSAIDRSIVGGALIAGLVIAALTTALAAVRVLDHSTAHGGSLRFGWLLLVVGLAVAMWIQVGASSRPRELDPLVIGFPLVGITAGVGVITVLTRWVMRRVRRTGRSLPTPVFLAWRRVTSADAGASLLSAAMGIALGLVVFSAVVVDSLETATAAKTTALVGGTTQVGVLTSADFELPDDSTIVQRQSTLFTVGGGRVVVLVIDPETYVDGVSWHPLFGSSPEELLELLETPVDADVAAVVIGDRAVPADGGFGTSNVLSYDIVGELAGAPLASAVTPTLVVRSDQVEAAGRRLHELGRPADVDPDDWAEQYRSPVARAARLLVSQQPAETIVQQLEALDIETRDLVTASGERDQVGNRAARWTFEYLRLLAVVAAIAAVGTLLFYLSERRTARRLSTAMALRMGLRRSTAQLAAVIEVLGLVVLALVSGTISALVLAARVFARFEPNPQLPPSVGIQRPLALFAVIAGTALATVVLAAVASQRAASRQRSAEVLRGS
jgi:hypothetical protein